MNEAREEQKPENFRLLHRAVAKRPQLGRAWRNECVLSNGSSSPRLGRERSKE